MNSKGFTLIELIVVIAIIAILSGVVLLNVTQYINVGKDSNVKGNLSVLITDGETFYNIGNTYSGFCGSPAVTNAWAQISTEPTGSEQCHASSTTWIACAQEFANTSKAYCVDSTGYIGEKAFTCSGVSVTKCCLIDSTCPS